MLLMLDLVLHILRWLSACYYSSSDCHTQITLETSTVFEHGLSTLAHRSSTGRQCAELLQKNLHKYIMRSFRSHATRQNVFERVSAEKHALMHELTAQIQTFADQREFVEKAISDHLQVRTSVKCVINR